MELSRAASDLLGPTESRVLASLARLADPVSGRQLARLAEADPSTVYRYLQRLREIGLVRASENPSATLYRLNRAHVYWAPLEAILASPARIEERIAELVQQQLGSSARVAAFGSTVAGTATARSDYDLLVIPDDDVTAADRAQLVSDLGTLIEDMTGNEAQVIDLSPSELHQLTKAGAPIAVEWKKHARPLDGRGRLEWTTA